MGFRPHFSRQSHLIHRAASLALLALALGGAFATMHPGIAARLAMALILPVLCIWFPEAMGQWRGVTTGRFADENSTPPLVARWGGWVIFVIITLVFFLLFSGSSKSI